MRAGIPVETKAPDGTLRTRNLQIISENTDQNTYLAAQQVTVIFNGRTYRLDVVMYCNGLPVGIIELKDQGKKLSEAYNQMVTYQSEIPQAFTYNIVTIMGQPDEARYGTIGTPLSHTAQWNYDADGAETPTAPTTTNTAASAPSSAASYRPSEPRHPTRYDATLHPLREYRHRQQQPAPCQDPGQGPPVLRRT